MSTINLPAKLLFAGLGAEAPFHLAATLHKTGKQSFGCDPIIHADLQIDPLSKGFIRVNRGLRESSYLGFVSHTCSVVQLVEQL
jgi:hypothetical protein